MSNNVSTKRTRTTAGAKAPAKPPKAKAKDPNTTSARAKAKSAGWKMTGKKESPTELAARLAKMAESSRFFSEMEKQNAPPEGGTLRRATPDSNPKPQWGDGLPRDVQPLSGRWGGEK